MAEIGWLAANDMRSYPLAQDNFSFDLGGSLPRKGIVDAGFMPGIDSYFEIGVDTVNLYSVTVTATTISFKFRATYDDPARDFLRCYEWLFTFNLTDPFGATQHVSMTPRLGGAPDPYRGQGFLTIGDISELATLAVGEHHLTNEPAVEPATIQSLTRSFVKTINLANMSRPCPPGCPCSSSSSSSESSSSAGLPCEDPDPIEPEEIGLVALPQTTRLVGEVLFKQGYNSQVSVIEASNLIQLNAGLKAGIGEPCQDLRTDDDGNIVETLCLPCAGPIYSIDGIGADIEHFRLISGPGVVITANPDEHELVISLDTEGICEVNL